jgi:hypothetical protein
LVITPDGGLPLVITPDGGLFAGVWLPNNALAITTTFN